MKRGSSESRLKDNGEDLNVPEAAETKATAGRRYFEKVIATDGSL